jgi:cytochrome c5
MVMNHRHYITLALLALFSCAAYTDPAASPLLDAAEQKKAADSWREHRLAYGKEIYEQACASCHDEGVDGAPAIGDRYAWSERSPLWSAVLYEHAKAGFLQMPAKGACPELTEPAVDAASEYLLSITFPELPLD